MFSLRNEKHIFCYTLFTKGLVFAYTFESRIFDRKTDDQQPTSLRPGKLKIN